MPVIRNDNGKDQCYCALGTASSKKTINISCFTFGIDFGLPGLSPTSKESKNSQETPKVSFLKADEPFYIYSVHSLID